MCYRGCCLPLKHLVFLILKLFNLLHDFHLIIKGTVEVILKNSLIQTGNREKYGYLHH